MPTGFQRVVPDSVRREIDKQESAEFYPIFLRFQHPSLTEDIRVVSDTEDFMLDGKLYQGFTFDIKLLTDGEGMPSARLSVQNVDRRIGEAVLNSVDSIRLEIQIIAGSEFDLSTFPRTELNNPSPRIYRARQLFLTDVEGNPMLLTGTIRSWDYTQETWPALRATQARFPGLYW